MIQGISRNDLGIDKKQRERGRERKKIITMKTPEFSLKKKINLLFKRKCNNDFITRVICNNE